MRPIFVHACSGNGTAEAWRTARLSSCKIVGESLQDISGLNYEEQRILATDLAAFLKELHSIPTAMGCLAL